MNAKGAAGVKKAGTGAEIVDLYKQMKARGVSTTQATKDIIAKGYSRGTTGAVILAYRRSIGDAD